MVAAPSELTISRTCEMSVADAMGQAQQRLLGTTETIPPVQVLRAGALQLRLRGIRLLEMRIAGHEIWHGAAFLYRDTGWGTPEPVVDALHHSAAEDGDGFEVRIEAHIPAQERINLVIQITGHAEGLVRYEVCATPHADLPCNRIGLCLLHPMSVAGRRVQIEHTDGRHSDSSFPTHVPPWPPFMLIRAIRHEYADQAWAQCRFEGEDFELEDQRNNADASFKTYSRSNLMPRPFVLHAGESIRQALTLRVESRPSSVRMTPPLRLQLGDATRPMPMLGLEIGMADVLDSMQLSPFLQKIAPRLLHLRLSLPEDAHHVAALTPGLAHLLACTTARLRLDIQGLRRDNANAQLLALKTALAQQNVHPWAVAVFPADALILQNAREAFAGSLIGSGTPHFFAQLNRLEGLSPVDFLSFTTASIVHDAADETVMHGLQSLPSLIDSVRRRHPGTVVHTGPSCIAAAHSPLGPQPVSDGTRRVALAARDPRTQSLFGAAWLLGHVAGLAPQDGVQAVSVLALTGAQGVLAQNAPSHWHGRPAFFVLQAMAGAHSLRPIQLATGTAVAALALQHPAKFEILLANLENHEVEVHLPALETTECVQELDTEAIDTGVDDPWRPVETSQTNSLRLSAWAIMRLQLGVKAPHHFCP